MAKGKVVLLRRACQCGQPAVQEVNGLVVTHRPDRCTFAVPLPPSGQPKSNGYVPGRAKRPVKEKTNPKRRRP